jgi:hypothetical protein
MLSHILAFSGVPHGTSAVLDLTPDFAPLLIGLYLVLGLCVVGLGMSSSLQRTHWGQRHAERPAERSASRLALSEAT